MENAYDVIGLVFFVGLVAGVWYWIKAKKNDKDSGGKNG